MTPKFGQQVSVFHYDRVSDGFWLTHIFPKNIVLVNHEKGPRIVVTQIKNITFKEHVKALPITHEDVMKELTDFRRKWQEFCKQSNIAEQPMQDCTNDVLVSKMISFFREKLT